MVRSCFHFCLYEEHCWERLRTVTPPTLWENFLGIIIGSKILTAFQLIIHRAVLSFKTLNPFIKPAKYADACTPPPRPLPITCLISFLDKSVCNDTLKLVFICIFNFLLKHSFPHNDEQILLPLVDTSASVLPENSRIRVLPWAIALCIWLVTSVPQLSRCCPMS